MITRLDRYYIQDSCAPVNPDIRLSSFLSWLLRRKCYSLTAYEKDPHEARTETRGSEPFSQALELILPQKQHLSELEMAFNSLRQGTCFLTGPQRRTGADGRG